MSRTYILVSFLVAVCFIAMSALFTVDERQKALVLQFGEVIKTTMLGIQTIPKAGIKWCNDGNYVHTF